VVEADGGDHRNQGEQHVGGVEPAAHADLKHGHLHPALGVIGHRQGGDDLKHRHLGARLKHRRHALHQPRYVLLTDELPIGLDALSKGVQVRRGVHPCAVPRRPKDGLDHGGNGALALGAGHVHRGVPALGMAEL